VRTRYLFSGGDRLDGEQVVRRLGEPERRRIAMTYMNEAGWDRIARVVVGVALLVVGFGVIGGTAGTVVGVVGFVPLVTGLVGYCPIYRVLHVCTNHRHETPTAA
jgi:hypothetical protein